MADLDRKKKVCSLLALQDNTTISEWCLERKIDPKDISSYYDYLDVLSVPNNEYSFNDEIISHLYSLLPSYTLSACKCVSKQWSLVRSSTPNPTTYYEDAATEMSWYHISQCDLTQSGVALTMMSCSARRGYQLKLEGYGPLEGMTLCECLSEGTDSSSRYLKLLKKHFDCYDTGSVRCIIDGAIRNDDFDMFKYSYRMSDVALVDIPIITSSYYGRIKYLEYLSNYVYTDPDTLDIAVISSFCGGHYKEVNEFFLKEYSNYKEVTYAHILKAVLRSDYECYELDMASLEPLVFLLENVSYNKPITHIRYLYEVDYSLEEFARLWSLVRDKVTNKVHMIGDLVIDGRL